MKVFFFTSLNIFEGAIYNGALVFQPRPSNISLLHFKFPNSNIIARVCLEIQFYEWRFSNFGHAIYTKVGFVVKHYYSYRCASDNPCSSALGKGYNMFSPNFQFSFCIS